MKSSRTYLCVVCDICSYYYPLHVSETAVRIFGRQHLNTIMPKTIPHYETQTSSKIIFWRPQINQFFCQQHSLCHCQVATITSHPAVLSIVVSKPYVNCYCLWSAEKLADYSCLSPLTWRPQSTFYHPSLSQPISIITNWSPSTIIQSSLKDVKDPTIHCNVDSFEVHELLLFL